jgi:hypothetical protein
MASYPDEIYTPRAVVNKSGVEYDPENLDTLYAEDKTDSDDEIVAIETELGTNPKGSDSDVATRLDRIDNELITRERVGCSVYRSADYTLSALSDTQFRFDSELYDIGADFDPVTNWRFTAPIAGYYLITAQVQIGGCAAGDSLSLSIKKNGSSTKVLSSVEVYKGVGTIQTKLAGVVYLAAGDYLTMYYFAAAARAVNLNNYLTFMQIMRLY